eukprot:6187482-Pleurochrysis_carterae.AAC.2
MEQRNGEERSQETASVSSQLLGKMSTRKIISRQLELINVQAHTPTLHSQLEPRIRAEDSDRWRATVNLALPVQCMRTHSRARSHTFARVRTPLRTDARALVVHAHARPTHCADSEYC